MRSGSVVVSMPAVTKRRVPFTMKCPWSKRLPYTEGTTSGPQQGDSDLAGVVVPRKHRGHSFRA